MSGIAEFLSPTHIAHSSPEHFFSKKSVDYQTTLSWEHHLRSLPVVKCLPLTSILQSVGAYHTNFFVLDVEGAEMSILSSVDWSRFSFDVLCIEKQFLDEADDAIKLFLFDRNYTFWALVPEQNGQNNWFVRRGFQPSQHPGV